MLPHKDWRDYDQIKMFQTQDSLDTTGHPYKFNLMLKFTYGLLTKCEVKMAGYWPSSFFVCLWTETESRSINTQKRTRPIPSHLDRTNSVNKGFIIWLSGNFSCGIQQVVPSEQDGSILPARVANQSPRFGSSCPLAELAI